MPYSIFKSLRTRLLPLAQLIIISMSVENTEIVTTDTSTFDITFCLNSPLAVCQHYRGLLTVDEADAYFTNLLTDAEWRPDIIGGRELRRHIAAYGNLDNLESYERYNGETRFFKEWSDAILPLKKKIDSFFQQSFNYAHLNLYVDGDDSIGFHYDKGMVEDSVIVSVSLGVGRDFQVKPMTEEARQVWSHDGSLSIYLAHGDVLIMAGTMQKHYKHAVPKRSNRTTIVDHGIPGIVDSFQKARINITFRHLPMKQ